MFASGNRDKNVPTIVVSASQTADRGDIPVPLLRFQVLLLKSEEPLNLLLFHVFQECLALLISDSTLVSAKHGFGNICQVVANFLEVVDNVQEDNT